ncbi:hypothetical protein DRQ07_02095 [candidate division KSB1 bacterium]|nr:MAG: hypothetical protein DRQ07_02095 [candidate division KSB1 bacterium]
MKIKAAVLHLVFALSAFVIAAETPDQIIKKIESNFNKFGIMQITFNETYLWSLTGEKNSTNGVLLLKGKDKFKVTTDDQIIVSDGKNLWTYSKPSKRVVIDKLKKNDNTLLPRKIFLTYTNDYQSFLKGSEKINGKECWVIKFTDEKGDKLFPELTVWVDKEEYFPRRIEQKDLSNNTTVFTILDIKTEIETTDRDFIFSVPEHVQVIDLRTL